MLLTTWTPSSLIETDLVFLMKSQPVLHGPVIHHLGNYPSAPEWSPRRYSVIEISDGTVNLIIGSVAYHRFGFDTDNPYEPLVKYASSEWKDLLVREFDGPIEEAIKWDGRSTTINDATFPGV